MPEAAVGTGAPPPRRMLAVWCHALAIDRWRLAQDPGADADARPLALIADTAHGPRIAAANPAAVAAGAAAGMMLADARALCPALAVAPSDPDGDRALLEALALAARCWGPWTAIDPPDGLIVDVTGVAHLFGGERALLADARDRLARRGFAARLAIAPTAGASWALAHHGPDGAILDAGEDAAARLAALPVAALRLDAGVLLLLRRLGLKRLGDLAGVDRANLARRFRARGTAAADPLVRLDQLLGRVPEPVPAVLARPLPSAERRLAEPIRHRDLLDRVVADVCADIAHRLDAGGEGARRLDLELWRIDGTIATRTLELAAASRDPAHVAGLLGRRLDGVDAGFGIERVRLAATWTEPLPLAQRDLATPDERAQARTTSLAECVDRLTTRLGTDAVRRPVPHGSHLPERAQGWRPPLEPAPRGQDEPALHARPLKLLDRPEPIAVLYATPDGLPRRLRWRGQVREVARVEGPERIAPEWWRERSTTRLRDYYRIEDDAGRRYWIYRHGIAGDGRGGAPEWFLHGLCA